MLLLLPFQTLIKQLKTSLAHCTVAKAMATPHPLCADVLDPEEIGVSVPKFSFELQLPVVYHDSDPALDGAVRKLTANRC